MPNTRSAAKRVRSSERRRLRNKSIKSRVKTAIKKFDLALGGSEIEKAQELMREASSVIDRAANKGVIHRNAAARKKSRMAERFNQAFLSEAAQNGSVGSEPAPVQDESVQAD